MAMTKTRSSGDEIPAQLEKVLGQPDVASELFFPIDRASWRERKRRYFVKCRDRRIVRSTIGGVRFQCSERAEPGTSAVTDCQNDLVRLVRSLAIMRQDPELAEAVLSKDVLLHRQLGKAEGKRAKFGLLVPNNGRFRDDTDAARLNHRRIVRAIRRAGFKVIQPEKPFEPQTGMGGLQKWSSELRLRKRRNYWWLLLLLLPVLWVPPCNSTPFDMPPVETAGLILLLDESPSMTSAFPKIRQEARRYLNDRRDSPKKRSYIDIIRYSDVARSPLNELRPLDGGVEKALNAFLDEKLPDREAAVSKNPQSSLTNLKNAMEKAAQEIITQKEPIPVTVLILTDAVDSTIDTLNQDPKPKARFKNVEVHVNATTPRLLPGADPNKTREGANETGLEELCTKLDGQFGPGTRKSGGGQPWGSGGQPGGGSGTGGGGGQPGGGGGGPGGGGGQPGGGGGQPNRPPGPQGSHERSGGDKGSSSSSKEGAAPRPEVQDTERPQ
jgi:hypothetical protein